MQNNNFHGSNWNFQVGKTAYRYYMTSIYLKADGCRFKSVDAYLQHISKALKSVGVFEQVFYSTRDARYFQESRRKIEDRFAFARKKKSTIDMLCAFDSYKSFVDHGKNGPSSPLAMAA